MDETRDPVLASAALLAGVGCILCTLVYFITLGHVSGGSCFPLVLTVYGPILFGVDRLFLRRQRTMMSLALLNGGALAALLAFIFLSGGYQGGPWPSSRCWCASIPRSRRDSGPWSRLPSLHTS